MSTPNPAPDEPTIPAKETASSTAQAGAEALPDRLCLSALTCLRLRVALFTCGFSTLVLLLLSGRIITPHFGSGFYVISVLVTMALSALVMGHWLGGRLIDRKPTVTLFAGVLMAAAINIGLLSILRGEVLELTWRLGVRIGAPISALILFFPPLLLLGMAPIFVVRLEADKVEKTGRTIGMLYAITTAGALLGALLGGLFLMPSLRISTVMTLITSALGFMALLLLIFGGRRRIIIRRKRSLAAGVTTLAMIYAMVSSAPPRPAELVDMKTSTTMDLRVIEHLGVRQLFVNQTSQAKFLSHGRTQDKYPYFIVARLLMGWPQTQKVALVGLSGGGLASLMQEQNYHVECVEPSSEMIDLARRHLSLTLPESQIHAMDGRFFLREHPDTYDAVILDILRGERVMASLVSREGLKVARAALKPRGVLVVNTLGIDLDHNRPNQIGASIYQTLKDVFPYVHVCPASHNLLFFAADSPINPVLDSVELPTYNGARKFTWTALPAVQWPNSPVLMDDWNPLDFLDFSTLESQRITQRSSLPDEVQAALIWE